MNQSANSARPHAVTNIVQLKGKTMIPVRVKKLSDNDNTFETKLADIRYMLYEPDVGYGVYFLTENGGGFCTSIVKRIVREGVVRIHTLNSIYEVEYVK